MGTNVTAARRNKTLRFIVLAAGMMVVCRRRVQRTTTGVSTVFLYSDVRSKKDELDWFVKRGPNL